MSPDIDPEPVTVIGLGPMGQAMARALLDGGHPVTVWNRTASRADDLVAGGAERAPTPADAVRAAELVVLSLTDYQAMYDILDPATGPPVDLSGKVVVNLSSDTPERTRQAAAWAAERGARFLVGGVMVPGPMIGTEAAYVYYSGPKELLDAHGPTLALVGAPRYVGDDPGLAQLYYQAQLDVFLTALAGLLHATALVGSAGVPAAEFVPDAIATLSGIGPMMEGGAEIAREIDERTYPGDLSTTTMMGATAEHIVGASRTAGLDLALPLAVRSLYERAIDAGHGRDNWTSLIEAIRPSG
jgi:3-hydroxyisobutyrate dehydrogenase-like beta-hydroxyacid dehydrogenase